MEITMTPDNFIAVAVVLSAFGIGFVSGCCCTYVFIRNTLREYEKCVRS